MDRSYGSSFSSTTRGRSDCLAQYSLNFPSPLPFSGFSRILGLPEARAFRCLAIITLWEAKGGGGGFVHLKLYGRPVAEPSTSLRSTGSSRAKREKDFLLRLPYNYTHPTRPRCCVCPKSYRTFKRPSKDQEIILHGLRRWILSTEYERIPGYKGTTNNLLLTPKTMRKLTLKCLKSRGYRKTSSSTQTPYLWPDLSSLLGNS